MDRSEKAPGRQVKGGASRKEGLNSFLRQWECPLSALSSHYVVDSHDLIPPRG